MAPLLAACNTRLGPAHYPCADIRAGERCTQCFREYYDLFAFTLTLQESAPSLHAMTCSTSLHLECALLTSVSRCQPTHEVLMRLAAVCSGPRVMFPTKTNSGRARARRGGRRMVACGGILASDSMEDVMAAVIKTAQQQSSGVENLRALFKISFPTEQRKTFLTPRLASTRIS